MLILGFNSNRDHECGFLKRFNSNCDWKFDLFDSQVRLILTKRISLNLIGRLIQWIPPIFRTIDDWNPYESWPLLYPIPTNPILTIGLIRIKLKASFHTIWFRGFDSERSGKFDSIRFVRICLWIESPGVRRSNFRKSKKEFESFFDQEVESFIKWSGDRKSHFSGDRKFQ